MAATDNIIGMVIIVSVLLVAGIVLQTNQLNQSTTSFETNQDIYEQQKVSRDVESILQITEPVSKLRLSRIITDATYTKNGISKVYGFDFNQFKYIGDVFDSVYGKDNYFVEIIPPVSKARIIFLIDGSSSMNNDLIKIKELIPLILKNFKDRNYSIEATAYILNQGNPQNPVNASTLSNVAGITAYNIAPDNVIGSQQSGCTYDSTSQGVYNKYFLKDLKNSNSNYFVGFDLYTSNPIFKSANNCSLLDNNKIRGEHYEDWATGTAFVAKEIPKKAISDLNDPTMTIIVPMSDEIASGSEADYCYNQQLSPTKRIRCELCEADTARFERANKLVKFAIDSIDAEGFDYFVFPVAIKPELTVPSLVDQNFCGENGIEVSNCVNSVCYPCCNTINCAECKTEGDNTGVHNNPEVIEEMINEMTTLASSTGGKVIDLTKGYSNDEEFLGPFLDTIEKTEKIISIGTDKNSAQKIVVNRLLPTPKGNFIQLRVTFFGDSEKQKIKNLQTENRRPIVNLYYSPKEGVIKKGQPFEIVFDARNSFDPEGDNLTFAWKESGVIFSTEGNGRREISTVGVHNFEVTITDKKGAYTTKTFTVTATEKNILMRLLFIPTNWHLTEEFFLENVNKHALKFTNQIACGDQIEIVPLDLETQNCTVNTNNEWGTIKELKNCANRAGYDSVGKDMNSRIIGLIDDILPSDNGYQILGYTYPQGNNPTPFPVLVTYGANFVTSHELGHSYGACDEYSLEEWIKQRSTKVCPNPYPSMCGFDSTTRTVAPVQMQNSSPYCTDNKITSFQGTYLNCKNFFSKDPQCNMDNICNPATESYSGCPTDCLILDCPGTIFGQNNISIMGSVIQGSYSGRITGYPPELLTAINNKICN